MKSIFLSALFLLPIAAIAQGVGADPATIEFKVARGQTATRNVKLFNNTSAPVRMKIYINDWLRDANGGHLYFRPDTLPQSCASWITMGQANVDIPPGKAVFVPIKLTVPDVAGADTQMKWAMLFAETNEENKVPDLKAKMSTTFFNKIRLGVHIYQTPPGVTEKAIKMLEFSKDTASGPNSYVAKCQNTGRVMIESSFYLELNNLKTAAKIKTDPVQFPMFPNQVRLVRYTIPENVQKGQYSALAILDAGEDVSLEAADAVIEVK